MSMLLLLFALRAGWDAEGQGDAPTEQGNDDEEVDDTDALGTLDEQWSSIDLLLLYRLLSISTASTFSRVLSCAPLRMGAEMVWNDLPSWGPLRQETSCGRCRYRGPEPVRVGAGVANAAMAAASNAAVCCTSSS